MTKLILVTKESAYRFRNDSVRIARWQLAGSIFAFVTIATALVMFVSFTRNATAEDPRFLEMLMSLTMMAIGIGVFGYVHFYAFSPSAFPVDLVVTQAELEEMHELGVPEALIADICETTFLWSNDELKASAFAKDFLAQLRAKR